MRFVLGVGLTASLIAHIAWLNPISSTSGFEVNDLDGDVDITVDLFEESPPESAKVAEPKREGEGLDGGSDAGDGSLDAKASRSSDAASDSGRDGGTGLADAAPDALGDAAIASVDNGPKDSVGILGSAGEIKAADVYVTVSINAEAIRKNSVGKQTGPLLQGLNQWHDFLSGTNIDPVRDAEWVMIYGPSLRDTTKAVIVIRYNLTDAQMDAACDLMAQRYAAKGGGPLATGHPGMKAWLAFADKGERILVRPQSHTLVILPSRKSISAEKEKQLLQRIHQTVYPARLKNANEAVRVIVKLPHKAIAQVPQGLSEVRLRAIPGANDSATIYIEGDCSDGATCSGAQRDLEATLEDLGAKASVASIFTAVPAGVGKVLNEAQLSHDTKHLRMQVELSRAELQDLLTFMTGFLKHGGF